MNTYDPNAILRAFQTRQSSFDPSISKHKVFISYYHNESEHYRTRFENLFGNIFINKSVEPGEINDENSTDYIKKLIRENYIADSSIMVVLISPKTYCRKHIDWEIYAALDKNAGIIGLCLPGHSSYQKDNIVTYEDIPQRLADNHKSGYAQIYDWTENENNIKTWIQTAFNIRIKNIDKRDFSLPQYLYNRCE